jgi:hypothetical protein
MPMSPRLLRPRATGFNPKSISGLQLWLDASDQSTLTLNGTTVSEWRSKAGSISIAQGTASAQPTLLGSYYLGRSALTFDGGDLLYSATASLAIAPCTSFVVFDETSAVSFAGVLVGSPASGDDFGSTSAFITTSRDTGNIILRGSNVNAAAANALSVASASQGASAYGRKLATAAIGANSGFLRTNAVLGTTDSAHTASGSSAGTLVGGRFLGGAVSASFRFTGRICEILHYSQELSASQISTVEAWLSKRWGISL